MGPRVNISTCKLISACFHLLINASCFLYFTHGLNDSSRDRDRYSIVVIFHHYYSPLLGAGALLPPGPGIP